jgi:4,5-dihydroxyphthalate decarboxylase
VNQPGRAEKVSLRLPTGVALKPVGDRSLNEMLLAGDLDAVMSAHPPRAFEDGSGEIVRLLPDFLQREEEYWRGTGVGPIMHVIAIRAATLRAHPWVAASLYRAFERAKQTSMDRMPAADVSSRIPVLYGSDALTASARMFGRDYWLYGLEPNRPTLEAFLLYAYEQGICHRRLTPEEIFLDPER